MRIYFALNTEGLAGINMKYQRLRLAYHIAKHKAKKLLFGKMTHSSPYKTRTDSSIRFL